MPDEFQYDVFLNHSAKDKRVVRAIAERLRKDGQQLWFDEWVLKAGDSIPGLPKKTIVQLAAEGAEPSFGKAVIADL